MSVYPWGALLAVVFWGASFVATRVALGGGFEPLGLVVLRFVMGSLLLGTLVRLRGRPLLPEAADRGRALLLGLVLATHVGLQTSGLAFTSAIHTGWVVAFMPVAIAVGARLFLGQRLAGAGWGGVGLGLLGVGVVLGSDVGEFARAGLGDAIQLATIPTWAAYTLLAVRPASSSGSLRVTFAAMTVAMVVLALALPFTGVTNGPVVPAAWGALAFLGIVCSGIAYALWTASQARHGSHRTGATLYFEPLVTLGLASALLGERVTPRVIVGGAIVLLSLVLVERGVRAARLSEASRSADAAAPGTRRG